MANEAHKEPTMEEILASIRKIISDDSEGAPAPAAKPAAAAPEPVFANDDLDDLEEVENVMFDEDTEDDDFEAVEEFDVESFEEEEVTFEEEETDTFESLLDAARSAEAEPEPEPEPAPIPVSLRRAPPQPEPAPVETPMTAAKRLDSSTLTDDTTATAAAGALGKLLGKMDLGGENTIEGLVREMLRPMIKEWLDENLARIVEDKVEAEVQRIARMAR
ncbi:MAG: DUF2497 domain-containing protein [Hyphomonas sp.]|uniref:DUF2497 domain-containing protein n=1 Tax=Hyphomonas sp. TaxID=87 RepID=UPI00352878D2